MNALYYLLFWSIWSGFGFFACFGRSDLRMQKRERTHVNIRVTVKRVSAYTAPSGTPCLQLIEDWDIKHIMGVCQTQTQFGRTSTQRARWQRVDLNMLLLLSQSLSSGDGVGLPVLYHSSERTGLPCELTLCSKQKPATVWHVQRIDLEESLTDSRCGVTNTTMME